MAEPAVKSVCLLASPHSKRYPRRAKLSNWKKASVSRAKTMALFVSLGQHQYFRSCIFLGVSIEVMADILVDCRSTYLSLCWPILGRDWPFTVGREPVESRLICWWHLAATVYRSIVSQYFAYRSPTSPTLGRHNGRYLRQHCGRYTGWVVV